MDKRVELLDEQLESVSGGTIKASYNGTTQTGKVWSDQVEGTYIFTGGHSGDVVRYIVANQFVDDAERINYMINQGWIVRE